MDVALVGAELEENLGLRYMAAAWKPGGTGSRSSPSIPRPTSGPQFYS